MLMRWLLDRQNELQTTQLNLFQKNAYITIEPTRDSTQNPLAWMETVKLRQLCPCLKNPKLSSGAQANLGKWYRNTMWICTLIFLSRKTAKLSCLISIIHAREQTENRVQVLTINYYRKMTWGDQREQRHRLQKQWGKVYNKLKEQKSTSQAVPFYLHDPITKSCPLQNFKITCHTLLPREHEYM